ncbi:MAG: LemA family protein [Nitrospirae bacterium]|nr:LemA family protein [Nitrospirota bacterium]
MYLIIAIVLIVIIVVFMYNRLIRSRNLLNEAWSGIDVQLKRRHDLIPNIIETVKGYKEYEEKVLANITSLRSKLTGTTTIQEKGQIENSFTQALKSIFALAEAYPDLKANQNFVELQNTLRDIEDQIQMARRYYNGAARNYNIIVESFPGNVLARLFNFNRADFFEIEYATEREVPDVKF